MTRKLEEIRSVRGGLGVDLNNCVCRDFFGRALIPLLMSFAEKGTVIRERYRQKILLQVNFLAKQDFSSSFRSGKHENVSK